MARRPLAVLAVAASLAAGAVVGVVAARALIAQRIEAAGRTANGWTYNLDYGRFGSDYLLRAAVARFGLGANQAEESVYYNARIDADGRALNGRSNYVLHFAKDALPPVDAFWSVSLVSADDLFFVENPIRRYAIGDRTKGLARNPDGSLDIKIQFDQPLEGLSNWLPCPAGDFVLLLRAYEPRPAVLNGRWAPPPVRRAERLA